MGRQILELAESDKNVSFVKKLGKADRIDDIGRNEIDCLLDFSSPEGLQKALAWTQNQKCPIVSGTTGISEEIKKQLEFISTKVPVLWSSNMSPGINTMLSLIETLAKLKDFDFQIEEIHHKEKKDSPSGTALTMQSRLESASGSKAAPPLSIRGGGIFGIHRIFAMAQDEIITIEHQATSRAVFARGALAAGKWIYNKPPGLYSMQEVLGGA